MSSLRKKALDLALELNQRLAHTAANGTDWLLKRDTLMRDEDQWASLSGEPAQVPAPAPS